MIGPIATAKMIKPGRNTRQFLLVNAANPGKDSRQFIFFVRPTLP